MGNACSQQSELSNSSHLKPSYSPSSFSSHAAESPTLRAPDVGPQRVMNDFRPSCNDSLEPSDVMQKNNNADDSAASQECMHDPLILCAQQNNETATSVAMDNSSEIGNHSSPSSDAERNSELSLQLNEVPELLEAFSMAMRGLHISETVSPAVQEALKVYMHQARDLQTSKPRNSVMLQHVIEVAGTPLLHLACQQHTGAGVAALLRHGADVRATDADGAGPLHQACNQPTTEQADTDRITEVIEVLMKHRANPNLQCTRDVKSSWFSGSTPLMWAAMGLSSCKGDSGPSVLRLLIKHGAKLSLSDSHGETALHHAAEYESDFNVTCLLQSGVDCEIRNTDGWTALFYAASEGSPQMVQAFVAHGAKTDATDAKGENALFAAARGNNQVQFHD